MANIQTFLENILSARYGKDVRQSIHDAIEEVDRVADTAQGSATEAAAQAEQYRNETEQLRNEVAEIVPEGYADLVEQVQENTVKVDTIIEKADLGIKETASGEEIHLTDSKDDDDVPEFHLLGKIEQNTTSGKNIIESVEKLNWDINSSGTQLEKDSVNKRVTVTTNGTSNYSGIYIYPKEEMIGKKCTVSADITISSGSKIKFGLNNGLDMNITANQKTRLHHTVTVESKAFAIYSGEQVAKTITVEKLQIEYGEVATPFEEYTGGMATPNPQYPQPIEVSGESYNLLENTATSKTVNGVEFVVNEDGSVFANGLTTEQTIFLIGKISGVENVILSGCAKGGSDTSYLLQTFDTNNATWGDSEYGNGKKITLDKSHIYDVHIIVRKGVTIDNITFYPMIRKASVKNDRYMPYGKGSVEVKSENEDGTRSTTATIPTENGLAGIKVTENGNYTDQNGQQWICDEIVKYADGSGAYIQRIDKAVFDGSEDERWVLAGTYGSVFRFDIPLPTMKTYAKLLCNSLIVGAIGTNDLECCNSHGAMNRFLTQIKGARLETSDVNGLKTFLATNPMIILYELAEPIHTPLTAEEIAEIEKLQTFYPITNISNDFDCGMSVTYNADSKNYIDRMVAEQVASIVANMNN